MARAEAGEGAGQRREIRLLENPSGKWTARDIEVGVSAEGETREAALEHLDAVVAAVTGDGGREPTDEEIRDLGVDPDVARPQDGEQPDIFD